MEFIARATARQLTDGCSKSVDPTMTKAVEVSVLSALKNGKQVFCKTCVQWFDGPFHRCPKTGGYVVRTVRQQNYPPTEHPSPQN